MPNRREHIKCAKRLLGSATPVVHTILDQNIRLFGGRQHRYFTHNLDTINSIGILLGPQARKEAILHIIQDWGLIQKQDYAKVPHKT